MNNEEVIKALNDLGMVSEDSEYFRPRETNWSQALAALKANPNPAAQKLYQRLARKYKLSTEKSPESVD